jgi:hypothetical protein
MILVASVPAYSEYVRGDLFNSRPVAPLDNGYERTLQEVFDGITPGGAGLIDAVDDQIANAIFTNVGSESTATMVIEIAGFAMKNTFGIYSFANPNRRATIFNGLASAGDVATISFDADGDVTVEIGGRSTAFEDMFAPGGAHDFGFFITTPQRHVFFTEDSRNPPDRPQALIYQGDDRTRINVGGDQLFESDEFIIAFEDLVYRGGSDQDFQDMVVFVESITPVVPAPGAAALGLLGLCMTGWVRRRLG